MVLQCGRVELLAHDLVISILKNNRQFCRWFTKFESLPLKLKKDIESELIKSANYYCVRNGLSAGEFVITMIRSENLRFSFVVTLTK
jgi:hypothetical protein